MNETEDRLEELAGEAVDRGRWGEWGDLLPDYPRDITGVGDDMSNDEGLEW